MAENQNQNQAELDALESSAAAKKRIAGEVTDALKDAADLMGQIEDLFKSEGLEKEAEYYAKQKERHLKMAGWYDPAAKKQAKIDRMKKMLAKLEAEAEADRGN